MGKFVTHVIFFPTKNSTFAEAALPFQLHTLVKHAQYCNHAVQSIVVYTVRWNLLVIPFILL